MSNKQKELEFLSAWATHVGEYLEARDPHRRKGGFTGPIEVCVRSSDLRSLRVFKNDLSQTALALSKEEYAELDRELNARFGLGLRGKLSSEQMLLATVMQRGKIVDDDEYRMLEERAEEIWEDSAKSEELERINELLAAY